jgi:hypothetical protein
VRIGLVLYFGDFLVEKKVDFCLQKLIFTMQKIVSQLCKIFIFDLDVSAIMNFLS